MNPGAGTTAARSQWRPVLTVVAGLAGLTAAMSLCAAYSQPPLGSGAAHRAWWPVAVLFALTQASVLNVQLKRETRAISLTELAVVLGLFLLPAQTFVLARVVGGFAAQVVARRQYRNPLKLAFNTSVVVAEAVVAIGTFRVVDGGVPVTSPRAWAAALAAAVAAHIVSAVAVAALIALLEGRPTIRGLAGDVRVSIPYAVAGATVGLVAALALEYSAWATVPLAAVAVLGFFGYRVHTQLVERHDNVERLYQFSQVVNANSESDRILAGMLTEVCDMLHADAAHLTFFVRGEQEPETEALLRRGGELERRPPHYLAADAAWLVSELAVDGKPVLLSRETKDAASRHWLTSRGLREAILVPLHSEQGIVGSLGVTDRLGESRGFDASDLQLLETVANHASIALRHGELVDRLRHDSLHDALTGAPNRSYLHKEVERRFVALTAGGQPFAVAMLDLDSFKDVNDTLGHHHGDALLREVYARLSAALAGRAVVSRFGGDEFAVLLPDCASTESASRLCRVLLDALTTPVLIDGTAVDVGASIGVALAPMHATSIEHLFKRADVAMYVAKQGGREVVVFDPAHETNSPYRLALVAALRSAIAEGAIDIHVQPQLDLETGEITSVEALARWTDPERGPIPPDEFIALAERSGLIRPLTDLVLEKAVRACAEWQDFAPDVSVAVNLSARSLRDETLDDQIDRLLHRHRLPARLLTLEITESSVMADPARMLGLLHRLRLRGLRLSIDDFGTGYSSLAYLRRLPVQEVKVDRTFVQRMDSESEDAAIVRAIVELAHTLDLAVVAEGVENASVVTDLHEMSCELAQGYYIGRPMRIDEFRTWFTDRQLGTRRLVAVDGGRQPQRRGVTTASIPSQASSPR